MGRRVSPPPPPSSSPLTDEQRRALDRLGQRVDAALAAGDVRLTVGGEPTFVAADQPGAAEWLTLADGPEKRRRAPGLTRDLLTRLAPGGVIQLTDGKWYPGEDRPRWRLELIWRSDGVPLWGEASRMADHWAAAADPVGGERPVEVLVALAERVGLPDSLVVTGPAVAILPLRFAGDAWESARWPPSAADLFPWEELPAGHRLPLERLQPPGWEEPADYPPDPFAALSPLPAPGGFTNRARIVSFVRTAVVAEVREGTLHLFFPPLRADGWVAAVGLVDHIVRKLDVQVALEGYGPPIDPRLERFSITPDPGVLEVNVPPAGTWAELVRIHTGVAGAAAARGLSTERFLGDGRPVGTGGGHHITLGGPSPEDSPLLRRPDLLRSLLTYWQHHPALSYLFSGLFVGPTSQAPRIDEARHESLYELEIAFAQVEAASAAEPPAPWLIDRLFRHLLIDLTGNTHRAEFCVDKLFSPDSPTGRLGLLELRAFETQPHVDMNLLQMLLVRAIVARCWDEPYRRPLRRWGTTLHDRFLLPHHLWADLGEVVADLAAHGLRFDLDWFSAHLEHRCPRLGSVAHGPLTLELRTALKPWPVLGEEPGAAGTTRPVDSTLDRLQARVTGRFDDRFLLACQGRRVPLSPTGTAGEYVAGVRFRARQLVSSLHPRIPAQAPLRFELIDTENHQAVAGCAYHVMDPGGRSFDVPPADAREAAARRAARFVAQGPAGPRPDPPPEHNPEYPMTLDLRRGP